MHRQASDSVEKMMPKRSERPTRFSLPNRIRTALKPADNFTPRLSLADRIAELPGVAVVESDRDAAPYTVRVMLERQSNAAAAPVEQIQFADISREGIVVRGLSSWDKHKALSSGWGKLRERDLLIFLPRDDRELEVCWTIIKRAYDYLVGMSNHRSSRTTNTRGFPLRLRPWF